MFDISRAVKAKIENLSKENLAKAQKKCILAGIQIKEASETKNNQSIEKAINYYFEAIELYSKLTEPYLALAYLAWQMDKPEDSIKILNKVLNIEPFNVKAQKMLKIINSEIKSNKLAKVINKHSSKSLSKAIKNSAKPKKDLFSKLLDIFKFKPNKTTNNKQKEVLKTTDPLVMSLKPVENVRQNNNGTEKNNFFNLVQQTKNSMYKK